MKTCVSVSTLLVCYGVLCEGRDVDKHSSSTICYPLLQKTFNRYLKYFRKLFTRFFTDAAYTALHF